MSEAVPSTGVAVFPLAGPVRPAVLEGGPSPASPSSRTDRLSVHSLPAAHQPTGTDGPAWAGLPRAPSPVCRGSDGRQMGLGGRGACLFLTQKPARTRPRKEGPLCGWRGPLGCHGLWGMCHTGRRLSAFRGSQHSTRPRVGAEGGVRRSGGTDSPGQPEGPPEGAPSPGCPARPAKDSARP